MRSFRRWTQTGLAALFALALPLSQAHAEDCVTFSGLKHCAVGGAKLEVQSKELNVHATSTSGTDGVAIDTEGFSAWSAGVSCEPSGQAEDTTVLTHVADGKVVATATVASRVDGQTITASFVDADGNPTTYSALLYSQGRLVASVKGLASGSVAARGESLGRPSCTHLTPKACLKLCMGGPIECNYCYIPCKYAAESGGGSGREPYNDFSFEMPFNGVSIGDGVKAAPVTTVGDKLVLVSDAPSAGAAQDPDQIVVTSTATTVSLSNESVTPR
ncbi:hypothetical protein HPC49_05840 [Pyxidicoccus fallax]|uniref:Lipoprotein n=1 Tax=Pyxidicoccus fallax TaxID=394095 RepID=A0A848LFN0_9BACT|nr:hypothetical protein [Pyxidicoccus fallax]NMO15151.1 hypothetical protein [Pyxidicoccus fallax]NPC77773.1 hypothetical protein [Pyxidicoccus fallax]